MAYTMTPWGYEVDGSLPPLVTVAAFNTATGGRWSSDPRTEGAVLAASAAVRNACGWHVAPSMDCRATIDTEGGRTIWLPASSVTDVTALTVDGEAATFQWSRLGQVVSDTRLPWMLQGAEVEYEAGYEADSSITGLVIGIANRSLALSPGVTQETAGGVSVSIAPSAATASVVASLTSHDYDALMPYRAVMAHAT